LRTGEVINSNSYLFFDRNFKIFSGNHQFITLRGLSPDLSSYIYIV